MIYSAAFFFVAALVAAIVGFGGALGAGGMTKILFFVFLLLASMSLVFSRRVPV
jgi:uncharacterized membrane protein YtjA (UPF0391 family)